MTSMVDPRMTVKSFLFQTASGSRTAAEAIGRSVKEHGVTRSALRGVRRLSGPALDAIDEEVGSVAGGLLDMDLGDILVAGWRKHDALTESARRTLAVEGSEEVVVLASHRVEWCYTPKVDLLLDGVTLNSFEFDCKITFDLTALSVVIRAGDLVAFRGGGCQVSGKLTLEGATVAACRRKFDVGLLVRLDRPIPLATPVAAFVPAQSTPGRAQAVATQSRP
jgi:hypothetical protein